ncbi:MAG: NYN domain-containing protein [Candidatus Zixiibacteriota bacterium]
MMHEKQPTENGDVAVIIDYDNLFYSIRSYYDAYPNLEQVLDAASRFGRVACSQAFGDWTLFAASVPFLFRAGIQPVFCPLSHMNPRDRSRAKSSVDATICVHTMKTFYTNPNIHTLVLVSGDRDYIPLVIELRQMGRKVVILAVGKALSSDLTEVADDTILYEDIVEGLVPREDVKVAKRSGSSADPYPILVEEVKLARQNRKPTVLAYLKLRLKDRIKGFDETKLKDSRGRHFKKFKDFIREAGSKGLIKLHTTGTANEVFLPEETPAKLSYFKVMNAETNESSRSSS